MWNLSLCFLVSEMALPSYRAINTFCQDDSHSFLLTVVSCNHLLQEPGL